MNNELKPYPEYRDSGIEWIGEVPEEWDVVKIKNLIKPIKDAIKTGPFGSHLKNTDMNGTKYKVFTQQNVISDNPFIGNNYVNRDKYNELKGFEVCPGDILVSSRGTIGFATIISDNIKIGILHPSLLRLRIDDKKILPNLLLHFFNSTSILLNQVNYLSNATTIEVIYSGTLKNLYLSIPSNISEQQLILNYIVQKTFEIDAFIADKEKLITLLEEKRQAVITETVTKGLDPNVKMKDSGIEWIGEIPAHWEVVKVGHAFYITLGKMIQPTLKNNNEKQVPYLKAQNIQNNYISYESVEKMFASPSEVDKYNIEKGDLLVCEGGEVARSAIAEESLDDYIFQNALHRVRGSKNGNLYYLHYLLNIVRSSGYIDILVNRATIAHFTRDKFSSLKIPLPSYSEQNKIIEYLNKEVNDIKSVQQIIIEQISKLKEYRESLIYEAVTGKIDLRNYKKVGETSESY